MYLFQIKPVRGPCPACWKAVASFPGRLPFVRFEAADGLGTRLGRLYVGVDCTSACMCKIELIYWLCLSFGWQTRKQSNIGIGCLYT